MVGALWCLDGVWYWNNLPISFRVTSLALGQSYDCPSASEATLKDMVNISNAPKKDDNVTIAKKWINHEQNTVKCHYNACRYNANASLTRSILGSQTAPTSWHALMTVPEWLSTWAKGVKPSRSDRPQRQWHLFVPLQLEQNKRIPPAGHVNTVDSWLIFDQTHWLFISDALRMPPFG